MISVCIDIGNAPSKTGIGIYGLGLLNALRRYAYSTVEVFEAGISFPSKHLCPLRRLAYLTRVHMLQNNQFHGVNVGMPENKFHVIVDGLSEKFITLVKKTPVTIPEVLTLLYVGQINKKKDVTCLIKSISQGIKKRALPPMKLIIAGGTGYGFEIGHIILFQPAKFTFWFRMCQLIGRRGLTLFIPKINKIIWMRFRPFWLHLVKDSIDHTQCGGNIFVIAQKKLP
jgi:hypothetical protein